MKDEFFQLGPGSEINEMLFRTEQRPSRSYEGDDYVQT